MIVFEFDYETHNCDGTLKPRPVWWNSCTSVTGSDSEDEDEIMEQLHVEQCGFLEDM